jgi:hypothetical protein
MNWQVYYDGQHVLTKKHVDHVIGQKQSMI